MDAVASSSPFDPDRILTVLDRHGAHYVLVGGVPLLMRTNSSKDVGMT